MKTNVIACSLCLVFLALPGCSLQKPDNQAARDPSAEIRKHNSKGYIGGHLYRHGRHIHHHPELTPPKASKEGNKE